jgi:hypothetical protein
MGAEEDGPARVETIWQRAQRQSIGHAKLGGGPGADQPTKPKRASDLGSSVRAGDGNRTRTISLGMSAGVRLTSAAAGGRSGDLVRECPRSTQVTYPSGTWRAQDRGGRTLEIWTVPCALTLAGITSPGSAGGARRGQLGSPWLFHEVREGENGEDQACPVA